MRGHRYAQAEIAKVLSCSQRVYSNYERGEPDIPTEILIKLANFHNVSVDYILNRTDNRYTNYKTAVQPKYDYTAVLI